jgi:hypothetical protein
VKQHDGWMTLAVVWKEKRARQRHVAVAEGHRLVANVLNVVNG